MRKLPKDLELQLMLQLVLHLPSRQLAADLARKLHFPLRMSLVAMLFSDS